MTTQRKPKAPTPHVGTMRFGGGCEYYDYSGKPHEKDGIA